MSNQSRQNQPDRSGQTNQTELARSGRGFSPPAPSLAPGLTVAHFTTRELETLRKACRDSDFEHLWRDYVQPALNRAEPSK